MVCNIWLAQRTQSKLKTLKNQIEILPEAPLKGQEEANILLRFLKYRRRKRFQMIEVIQSVFRVIVLAQSLKLPFSNEINPIFVSMILLSTSGMSLFKNYYNKVRIVNEQLISVYGTCATKEDKNKFIKNLSTAFHLNS